MTNNQQTSSESSEFAVNTDSFDRIKAENDALNEEHEALQKELQLLQEKTRNKMVLQENCEELRKLNEEMKEQHAAMKREIQSLKDGRKHVASLVECSKANNEAYSYMKQENERLEEEIQEVQQALAEVKSLVSETANDDIMKSLWSKHWDLRKERQNHLEEYYSYHSRGRLRLLNSIKKENADLEAQINDLQINIQMRRDLEELKAEEKALQKHSRKLLKKQAGLSKQIEIEEDWRQKYFVLRQQTDAIKQENEEAAQQIQILNNSEDLAAVKMAYKTLKAEKNNVTSQHTTLEREIEGLRSKIQKEQSLRQKTDNLRAEIEALSLTAPALQAQITELRRNLQGERVLNLMYETLEAERKSVIQRNDLMQREQDKLMKKVKKERTLKEKCAAMRAETDDLRREQGALKGGFLHGVRKDLL